MTHEVNAILHGTVLTGCATSAAWECALHLLRGVAGMQQGVWPPQKTMVISGTDLLEAPYHICKAYVRNYPPKIYQNMLLSGRVPLL